MKNKLAKLIEILPWLTMNQGASASAVAQHFSITEKEVFDLLQMAVLTGPGQFGGELVDIDFEDAESIYVTDAKGLNRAIKFSAAESLQIISGLHYLAQLPGVVDNQVLTSLQIKFMHALNVDQLPIEFIPNQLTDQIVSAIGKAISRNLTIRIEYASSNQGKITNRLIDPKKILVDDEISYVSAWCHTALAMRIFRLDRIKDLEETDLAQKDLSDESSDFSKKSEMLKVEILATKEAFLELDKEFIFESKVIDDNKYLVEFGVHNLNWLAREILASAGQIRAVSPENLVNLVDEKKTKWRELNHID